MNRFIKTSLEEISYHKRKISKPEKVLKKLYKNRTGFDLNLQNPKTFNEKLQWLKLNDHNPLYSLIADKYLVREYVKKCIGSQYLIPLIGVYESFEEIDFNSLPNQFVIKTTHDSGGVVICKDKKIFNIKEAKKKIKSHLKKNYYYYSMEWPYKNIIPKIICEEYMEDESGTELKDYKIFCFKGKPELIQVDFNRFSNHKRNLYNTKWEFMEEKLYKENDKEKVIQKPLKLEEMLNLAKALSKEIPFVRVDFYSIKNKVYFGEITFYPGSGYEMFSTEKMNLELGEKIVLPK